MAVPEELKFKGKKKKKSLCINTDRKTIKHACIHIKKYLYMFYIFRPSCSFGLVAPLSFGVSLRNSFHLDCDIIFFTWPNSLDQTQLKIILTN